MSQQSDLWDWLKDQPPRNFTFREAAKEIGTDEVAVRKALAAMSSRNIKEPGPPYPGLLRDFRHSGAYRWMGKNARLDYRPPVPVDDGRVWLREALSDFGRLAAAASTKCRQLEAFRREVRAVQAMDPTIGRPSWRVDAEAVRAGQWFIPGTLAKFCARRGKPTKGEIEDALRSGALPYRKEPGAAPRVVSVNDYLAWDTARREVKQPAPQPSPAPAGVARSAEAQALDAIADDYWSEAAALLTQATQAEAPTVAGYVLNDAFLADVVGVLDGAIVVRDVNGQVFTVKPVA